MEHLKWFELFFWFEMFEKLPVLEPSRRATLQTILNPLDTSTILKTFQTF